MAFFEEVGGGVEVGAGAEDVGDGELAALAVVGEGDVGGGVGVVDGKELSEGVVGVGGFAAAGPGALGEAAVGVAGPAMGSADDVELGGGDGQGGRVFSRECKMAVS